MQSELNEATDKAAFLRWMAAESLVAGLDDAEINRICQRWIKAKIGSAEVLRLVGIQTKQLRALNQETR